MIESKFFKLFQTLVIDEAQEINEVKDFEKFLKQYYPTRKKELGLFQYIKKHYLNEDAEHRLDKDTIAKKWLKINPVTSDAHKRISSDLSRLTQYLQKFLLWEKMEKQSLTKDHLLLEIYKERQLDDFFFSKIKKVTEQLEAHPIDTPSYHLDLMRLHHDAFFHTNFSKITIGAEPLEKGMEHLDSFFSLTKVKLAMEMLNRQNVLQEGYDICFLEEAIHYLDTVKKSSSIFIPLVAFLKTPTETGFVDLKKRLFKDFKKLPSDEQLIVITYLLNYTSVEMKRGKQTAYQQAFELFQFGIKHRIFIGEDGYISPIQFTNIVAIGSFVNEFPWVQNFIKKWSKFLDKRMKTNTVLMATTYLEFYKKNFEGVIESTASIDFGEDYFSLRTRGFVLCSYYELYNKTNTNLIKDYCNSFAQFLNRNSTINQSTLDSFFELVKFVRLLLHKKITYKQLKDKISKSNLMVSKIWVLEKIEGFKKH